MSNKKFLYGLFTVIAFVFFAMVILRPLWNYSAGTLNSSLDFITAWIAASIASSYKEN